MRSAENFAAPGRTKKERAVALAPHHTAREIAEMIGSTPASVASMLSTAGVKPAWARRRGSGSGGDRLREAKERRQAEGAAKVRDRRRFKSTPVPLGETSILADPDAAGSIFLSRVFEPSDAETVLKDGASNSKIGGDVLVGWLKGARIVTLTLEERATCPRSCQLWRGCYGNSMHLARRWRHGPELEARIRREVAALCADHDRVLVRLHVLGDFYSLGYVEMWGDLMLDHEGLAVFGFTAHGEETPLGAEIARRRRAFGRRWSIRHSGRTGRWGAFTIDFPTERKQIGDALVCPEQVDAMVGGARRAHCGSCAACWSTDAPIVFVEH